MLSEKSVLSLKQSIKVWEHEFQRNYDRLPTKDDMKLDQNIHKLYKAYKLAKSQAASRVTKSDENREVSLIKSQGSTENKLKTHTIDIKFGASLSDMEDEEVNDEIYIDNAKIMSGLLGNAELGPTPQANGKVLSLFDLSLTPPESSPLKPKINYSNNKSDEHIQVEFKTPTRTGIKRLQFQDLTPSKKMTSKTDLTSKLHRIAEDGHGNDKTSEANVLHLETMNNAAHLETPSYFAKYEREIDLRSPTTDKPPVIRSSPFLAQPSFPNNPSTPSKVRNDIQFQVSPSPLKSHRFMSFGNHKKLSDIYNEYKSIQDVKLFKDVDENIDSKISEEFESKDENTDSNIKRRKAITQKRTTRRWKIKPRTTGHQEDEFANKNVHDEVRKIKEENDKALANYIDEEDDSEEYESNSDEDLELQKQARDTAIATGKVKPLSNNYQRLKINDPRAKRFKMRMQKR